MGTKTLIIGSRGLKVKNVLSEEVSNLKVSGLFFVIGHKPATKYLMVSWNLMLVAMLSQGQGPP